MSEPGTPVSEISEADSHEELEDRHEEPFPRKVTRTFTPKGQVPSSLLKPDSTSPSYSAGVIRSSSFSISAYEPDGWWGQRLGRRPWREKGVPERRRTIPPEQEDRWSETRERVNLALKSTLGYTLDATHDLLDVGSDVLRFAPVPGLAEAARVLVTIWDSLQLVETNRLACLRLAERCADILLSIEDEIEEAKLQVGDELKVPMSKLIASFKSVHILLQKQVHRPFIKRYLKRDEIRRSISACDSSLNDALSLFEVSIQIRTLKQLQQAEARRQADHDRLLSELQNSSRVTDTLPVGDETPRQKPVGLPLVEENEDRTQLGHSAAPSGSSDGKVTSTSSGPSEAVQSPPPTPDSDATDSSPPQPPPPPSAAEVQSRIREIIEAQSAADHRRDMDDLRAVMRAALSTASDAEMISVLQVQREEMPEALKTLQRALEVEREKEGSQSGSDDEAVTLVGDEGKTDEGVQTSDAIDALKTKPGTTGFSNLRRRLTLTNQRRKSTRSTVTMATLDRSSRWSDKSEKDTLDREFLESGIDALRRLSIGQDINLPSWTITRYEVDLEDRIGVGFFSDVYRATWRQHTVAVKVCCPSTSKRIFLHEMNVWKKLNHPNVLVLLGASSAVGDPPWFFVSPYMKNGNLITFLKMNAMKSPQGDGQGPAGSAVSGKARARTEKKMVYEIAKGMEYLHRMGVMHGDLKGSNVLINDEEHCVIADFGQSEMKSEFYRMSGAVPPHGTLRWQAPEVMEGLSMGHLTTQVDVYAFSIVCVEIFTQGSLPWPMIDDVAIRKMVLEENKRPPVPKNSITRDLMPIVETCWNRDVLKRPTFATIVNELKKVGASKYSEGLSTTRSSEFWEEAGAAMKQSPDMRPVRLPDVDSNGSSGTVSPLSPTQKSPPDRRGSRQLNVEMIPMQRVITPIDEEKADSASASPVEYKPILRIPPEAQLTNVTDTKSNITDTPARQVTMTSDKTAETGTSSRTSTTNSNAESSTTDGSRDPFVVGLDIARFGSPIPADETIAQRKNESRYRLNLQHDFHPSLTLPLWDPTPVVLGAVGYLSRQTGTFVTLFDAFNPPKSPGGKAAKMSNMYGYGNVQKGNQRVDKRNVAQRGLDIIQGLLWFGSKKDGVFQRNISRRYTYPLKAGQKNAYLCTETTIYRYVDNLTTPKAWFVANIDLILELYGKEHRLQKEDVLLVVGTLDAENYGLFVSHNNPGGQVHFNVFSPPKAGQPWGVFATDDGLPPSAAGGPTYHEDVPGKHTSANKVSNVSSGPWNTVLLARLRFKPDDDRPTSL